MAKRIGVLALALCATQMGLCAGNAWAQQSAARTDEESAVAEGPGRAAATTADALPSVKDLLTKSDAAMGGRDAWMRSTSRRLKGLYQSEDSSVFIGIEILQKAPNKSLTKLTFQSGLMIREVCDGKAVWVEDFRGGYHEITGPAQAYRLKTSNLLANMKEFDAAANGKVTGTQKIGTHTTYVMEYANGKTLVSRMYFDADSGLVVHTEDVYTTPEGPYVVKTDLDDYRDVDGLKFAFRMKRTEKGAVTNIKLTQVNVNPEIDDSMFLKPESAK